MNGRVYDPLIGRFMSADLTIPNPRNLQSFNRYSYAYNKPLILWDPDGYEPWGTDSSGARTQYSDTGNGTASNSYTGDTYGTNSDYSSSSSSYGSGVSARSIAGEDGGGGTAIGVYSNKDGTWHLTQFGITFGEKSKRNLEVLEAALDSRSYLEMGTKRSVKIPSLYELAEVGFALALKRPVVKTPTPAPPLNVNPNINQGMQGKHIPGHNNYEAGKSTMNSDVNPQQLLDSARNGQYPVIGAGARGDPVVDFGRPIGIDAASGLPTQFGTIHSGNKGSHIVPASTTKYGGQH
jgi:hypothetical protein